LLKLRDQTRAYFEQPTVEEHVAPIEVLARQLGHTYHYHTHTEDMVEERIPPVTLTVEAWTVSLKQAWAINLREYADPEARYIEAGKNPFDFTIAVSLPDESGQLVQHHIRGVLRYYPHNGSGETLPTIDLHRCETAAQASQDSTVATHRSEAAIADTFHVFWQYRLVPQSTIMELAYWPSPSWFSENRDRVAPNWRSRIHGSLFFEWSFPIRNNKLELNPSIPLKEVTRVSFAAESSRYLTVRSAVTQIEGHDVRRRPKHQKPIHGAYPPVAHARQRLHLSRH
jgi:hypothetical protein